MFTSIMEIFALIAHLVSTLVRVAVPGGVRAVVAESLLLKHRAAIRAQPLCDVLTAARGDSLTHRLRLSRPRNLPRLPSLFLPDPSGLRGRNRAGSLRDEPVVLDAAVIRKVEAVLLDLFSNIHVTSKRNEFILLCD
jgi:hypothetical protein